MNEKLKAEAIRRMKALKLHNDGAYTCIPEFEKSGKLFKSEFHGILYWLDEEEQKAVDDFQKEYSKYEMLVYHCYKAHTEFGEILYMLFVSNDDDSKDFDYNLKDNIIYIYAKNLTEPMFSEFGTAYIKSQFGGIVLQ